MNDKYFVALWSLLFMSFLLLLAVPANAINSTTTVTAVQTTVPAGPPSTTTIAPTTTVVANETGGGSNAATPIPPIIPIGVGMILAVLIGYYALAVRRSRKQEVA